MALTALAVAILLLRVVQAATARADVRARRAALVTEVRRLADAQEALQSRENRWALELADPALAFTPSPGVILRLEPVGRNGWHAVATDTTLSGAPTRCGVYQGGDEASPHRSVVHPGVVGCW